MSHTKTPYEITIDGKVIAKAATAEYGMRLIECFAACEGMEDPAKDIAALIAENEKLKQGIKDAIEEMKIRIERLINEQYIKEASGLRHAIEILKEKGVLTDKTNIQ